MMKCEASREIYDFIISAFQNTCEPLGITKTSLFSYTAFMSYETFLNVSRKVHLFYQAEIGCVALKEKKNQIMEIKWLCVDEKLRHGGRGEQLLKFCESYSINNQFKVLNLGCFAGNELLINWYETHGFVIKRNKRKDSLICFLKKEL